MSLLCPALSAPIANNAHDFISNDLIANQRFIDFAEFYRVSKEVLVKTKIFHRRMIDWRLWLHAQCGHSDPSEPPVYPVDEALDFLADTLKSFEDLQLSVDARSNAFSAFVVDKMREVDALMEAVHGKLEQHSQRVRDAANWSSAKDAAQIFFNHTENLARHIQGIERGLDERNTRIHGIRCVSHLLRGGVPDGRTDLRTDGQTLL